MNKKYKKLYADIDAELNKRAIRISDMRKKLDDAEEQLKIATTEFGMACLGDDAEKYHETKERKSMLTDAVELYSNKLSELDNGMIFSDQAETNKVAREILSIQGGIIKDATDEAYRLIDELEKICNEVLADVEDGNELIRRATINAGLKFATTSSDFFVALSRDIKRYRDSENHNKQR